MNVLKIPGAKREGQIRTFTILKTYPVVIPGANGESVLFWLSLHNCLLNISMSVKCVIFDYKVKEGTHGLQPTKSQNST